MKTPPRIPLPNTAPAPPGWLAVSRGAALGFCCLVSFNFLEILHLNTSSVENWFCSLKPIPETFARVVLAMAVPSFALFAFRPALPGPVRNALLLIIALLIACSARDARNLSLSVPESLQLAAIARPLSVILTLLAAAAGLLISSLKRMAGPGSSGVLLVAATITVLGFPAACIQSRSIPGPLPDQPLFVVSGINSDPATDPGGAAEAAIAVWKLRPDSLFLFCSSDPNPSPNDFAAQARDLLAKAGIPSEAILQAARASSSDETLRMLGRRPELKAQAGRRAALIAPAHTLARLNLLAHRNGLQPSLIPTEPASPGPANPVAIVHESWLLMKCMAQPAIDYVQALRAPAETQTDFTESTDEPVDPEQLLKELHDSAAKDP